MALDTSANFGRGLEQYQGRKTPPWKTYSTHEITSRLCSALLSGLHSLGSTSFSQHHPANFFRSTNSLSDALFAAIVAVFPTKEYTPEITETRNSISLLAIEHQRTAGNIIAAKPLFSVNGYLFPLVSAIYTTESQRSQSVTELFISRLSIGE